MSRYIAKYINLEKPKRPTFWNGGSIVDSHTIYSNVSVTNFLIFIIQSPHAHFTSVEFNKHSFKNFEFLTIYADNEVVPSIRIHGF